VTLNKKQQKASKMTIHSKLYDILPEHYGYVLLTACGSVFVNLWMGMNVGKARKKYEVKYPIMYSSEKGGDNVFNCIQRVHQNTLENYPTYLFLLLVSGMQYPLCTTAAGISYLVGRIVYAKGYYSGDPSKRFPGGLMTHLAELVLLGGVVSFASFQLGWL
jgi:glutathione S-transferase